MRTTLTLDDDLAGELHRLARQTDRSFREVVDVTLRRGLAEGARPRAPLPPFRVDARARGFRAGVDVYRLNQLNDELEIEDFRREAGGRRQEPEQ